jgi:hypothetical protein
VSFRLDLFFASCEWISSYDLRANNVLRRMGMPGPTPWPFIGDLFNVIRKV